jgi:hypothetical protein
MDPLGQCELNKLQLHMKHHFTSRVASARFDRYIHPAVQRGRAQAMRLSIRAVASACILLFLLVAALVGSLAFGWAELRLLG